MIQYIQTHIYTAHAYCIILVHISVYIDTQREVSGRDPHSHRHIPVLYQYTQTNNTQRHKCSTNMYGDFLY